MTFADQGLEILSEDMCRRLLAKADVGRVAITVGALPAVLPVNYAMLNGDIVFLTAEGTKLDAALANAVVAFEVDEIDREHGRGWSVLVIGVASEITDPADIAGATALGIQPWAGGDRHHFVRIRAEFVSGRRIVPAAAATATPA